MKEIQKVFVVGHNGMVGSAIVKLLKYHDNIQIITKSRNELDLTNQEYVRSFFDLEKPDQVYLAAAKVGGIHANNAYPAEFIYDNLMIEANVINSAYRSGVKKLLFLGSSCIYPKYAEQPMVEESLLSGTLEPTNEPYAIAKIAGIKLCESYNRQYNVDYRSIMPTNLYGPGDNYHTENSHVIPALIKKFHEAKVNGDDLVNVWGSGRPKREFLYVDDMAAASIFVMEIDKNSYQMATNSMVSHLNVGSGSDISIKNLAIMVGQVVGYKGNINFDDTMPDGSPRKLIDSGKLNALGWKARIELKEGITLAYLDFVKNNYKLRRK
jgi:GDP-L-fucose synthase